MTTRFNEIYNSLKNEDYHILDKLNLTVQNIENVLVNQELRVQGLPKDNFVEYRIKLPYFVPFFQYLMFEKGRMVTQGEFVETYMKHYKEIIKQKVYKHKYEFLKARLSRAYTSIVRDVHFYHVLRDSRLFTKVGNNPELDMIGKVDVIVKSNGKNYGLQLRTKTPNSDKQYLRKENQLPEGGFKGMDITYIHLPIDLNKGKQLKTRGETFVLYGYYDVQRVLNFIRKHEEALLEQAS